MACAVSDGTTCNVPDKTAHTVSFVVPVSNGHPCLLTPGVPCQYNLALGKGVLRGVVGAGVCSGPSMPAVGLAQGLTSARRLGLVGGGNYLCERVVMAKAETCHVNE
jgi:hypothetical protein